MPPICLHCLAVSRVPRRTSRRTCDGHKKKIDGHVKNPGVNADYIEEVVLRQVHADISDKSYFPVIQSEIDNRIKRAQKDIKVLEGELSKVRETIKRLVLELAESPDIRAEIRATITVQKRQTGKIEKRITELRAGIEYLSAVTHADILNMDLSSISREQKRELILSRVKGVVVMPDEVVIDFD